MVQNSYDKFIYQVTSQSTFIRKFNLLRFFLVFHLTPIQELALPLILNGDDLIAQAKTGSGKTAAFGLGVLNHLELDNKKCQKVYLCPTHELASQVADEIRRLARSTENCKVQVICGGVSECQQLSSLEHGVHIIVGTPKSFKISKERGHSIRRY